MPKARAAIYDPVKVGRTAQDFIVLTKVNTRPLKTIVNGSSLWERIGQGQLLLHETEATFPWMDQGYVVTEQPRTNDLTQGIIDNTRGFAVANTDTMEIVATFPSYEAAVKAAADANAGKILFGEDEDEEEALS